MRAWRGGAPGVRLELLISLIQKGHELLGRELVDDQPVQQQYPSIGDTTCWAECTENRRGAEASGHVLSSGALFSKAAGQPWSRNCMIWSSVSMGGPSCMNSASPRLKRSTSSGSSSMAGKCQYVRLTKSFHEHASKTTPTAIPLIDECVLLRTCTPARWFVRPGAGASQGNKSCCCCCCWGGRAGPQKAGQTPHTGWLSTYHAARCLRPRRPLPHKGRPRHLQPCHVASALMRPLPAAILGEPERGGRPAARVTGLHLSCEPSLRVLIILPPSWRCVIGVGFPEVASA